MRKYLIILVAFWGVILNVSAIDIFTPYKFNPESLLGKTIILPTYNGGDNTLRLAYKMEALDNNDFNSQNLFTEAILGVPIKILDYRILDEGKKNETLCFVSEVINQNTNVVLRFPMNVKIPDFDGELIAQLFYGETVYNTMSASRYQIGDINLKYYLASEIDDFNKRYLGKTVYLSGNDRRSSMKQYTFDGFAFKSVDRKDKEGEYRFWVINYDKGYTHYRNNLDDFYAVLKNNGVTTLIKIKENEQHPLNENSASLKGLNKLILYESEYKLMCAQQYDAKKLKAINDTLVNREMFVHYKKNLTNKCCLMSDRPVFSTYTEVSLQNIGNHYVITDSITQIKTVDRKGNVTFHYYAVGRGNEADVFNKYIALLIDDSILQQLSDGTTHRKEVLIAEQKRQKENQERLAQLEKEEREYKNSLIRKYGAANANLILNGEVRIGFTKAMCEEAWGEPIYINNTITTHARWEQWVYGLGTYLYFSGNKLVGIQN